MLHAFLCASAFAQRKPEPGELHASTNVIFVGRNDSASKALPYMVGRLNIGAGVNAYGVQVVPNHYAYGGNFLTVNSAVNVAKLRPTVDFVIVLHGVFDSTNKIFIHEVVDARGNIAVSALPNEANVTYFYCGMNGDNRTITANNIGNALARHYGGSFREYYDANRGFDNPDPSLIGAPASAADDAAGNDNYGVQGEAPGSSNPPSDARDANAYTLTSGSILASTMSYSQACNSSMGLANVICITVDMGTGNVSVFTDGPPQDESPGFSSMSFDWRLLALAYGREIASQNAE